jgi:hypothetical protein
MGRKVEREKIEERTKTEGQMEMKGKKNERLRFEVSTAVTMMIIFWEITPCSSYSTRRFGGSCRLHLQGAAFHPTWLSLLLVCVSTRAYNFAL